MKGPKDWRSHKEDRGVYAKNLRTDSGDIILSSESKESPDKPLAMVAILAITAMLIGALALHDRAQDTERTESDKTPMTERAVAGMPEPKGSRIEMPLSVMEIEPALHPTNDERIKFLGATLLRDGKVEVRGEMQMHGAKRSNLSSYQVGVMLDKETKGKETFIDVNRGTWTVCLEPRNPLKPGEQLSVKAVLFGKEGRRELHRIRAVLVQRSGAPS